MNQAIKIPLGYSLEKAIQTLREIRDAYINAPYIRQVSLEVGSPRFNDDQEGMMSRLVDFVRSRLFYVEDPCGIEWVTAPDILLQQIATNGKAFGDCDDHALLLNTMLASVGFKTDFVAVKLNPRDTMFNHVISAVYLRSRWVDVDPTAKRVLQPEYREKFVLA